MAALAHGRPLITTNPIAEVPEFRHGENMWIVKPDDPIALAGAVQSLAGDEILRTRLGQGARELARSFSWDAIAAQTVALYAELVPESGR